MAALAAVVAAHRATGRHGDGSRGRRQTKNAARSALPSFARPHRANDVAWDARISLALVEIANDA